MTLWWALQTKLFTVVRGPSRKFELSVVTKSNMAGVQVREAKSTIDIHWNPEIT